MQTQTKEFWKLFKPVACSVDLKAQAQREIFDELVSNLVTGHVLPKEMSEPAVDALIEREKLASTGVGMTVAIPHVMLKGIDRAAVSLSVHRRGTNWRALDGEDVHLFFTVLRPEKPGEHHDPDRHLSMMRWISQLSRDGDFRRFAMDVKNRTELVALLKEMSAG